MTPEQRARMERLAYTSLRPYTQHVVCEDDDSAAIRAALAHIDALAAEVERVKWQQTGSALAKLMQALSARAFSAEQRATAAEQRVAEAEAERDMAIKQLHPALEAQDRWADMLEHAEARLREVEDKLAFFKAEHAHSEDAIALLTEKHQQAEAMLEAQRTEGASQTVGDLQARLREVEAERDEARGEAVAHEADAAALRAAKEQAEQTAAALLRLLRDDAYAMTFQSLGQYRSALIKAALHGQAAQEDARG